MKKLNKKGAVEVSMLTIIGAVIAVIIIIATVKVIGGVAGIFLDKVDEGTMATYTEFFKSTRYLLESDEDKCYFKFYAKPNFAFVGFDKGIKGAEERCFMNEEIEKPISRCGDDACICLCNGGMGDLSEQDCKNKNLIECFRINETVNEIKGIIDNEETDLVIMGEGCWYKNTGRTNMMIEKDFDRLLIYPVENPTGTACTELIPFE